MHIDRIEIKTVTEIADAVRTGCGHQLRNIAAGQPAPRTRAGAVAGRRVGIVGCPEAVWHAGEDSHLDVSMAAATADVSSSMSKFRDAIHTPRWPPAMGRWMICVIWIVDQVRWCMSFRRCARQLVLCHLVGLAAV
jgi:hypothetical protein